MATFFFISDKIEYVSISMKNEVTVTVTNYRISLIYLKIKTEIATNNLKVNFFSTKKITTTVFDPDPFHRKCSDPILGFLRSWISTKHFCKSRSKGTSQGWESENEKNPSGSATLITMI